MIKRQKLNFQMEKFMREGGALGNEKEKESTFTLTILSTRENGRMIKEMDLENSSFRTKVSFRVCFRMMNKRKEEVKSSSIPKATFMKPQPMAIFRTGKCLEQGGKRTKMGIDMKVSLKMDSKVD